MMGIYLMTHTKTNSRWTENLNVNNENLRIMSSKSHIMKGFLKQDTESTITVDRSNSIEVKVVFSIENAINKIK